MLKAANNYLSELTKKYNNCIYDIEYMYYFGGRYRDEFMLSNDNYNFVSVDSDDNVIGFITYQVNASIQSCNNFGIISFDKGNIRFIKDVKQAVDDIFCKYNFNRLDFFCFEDNPAIRGYRRFVKNHGGREIGMWEESHRLMDGRLHNAVMFEILKRNYRK